MGIRAHPRPATGKTSKGHYGTQSFGCAGQTVRPSRQSISQTSAGMLLVEDSDPFDRNFHLAYDRPTVT
jgi:hypothetical protein